MNEEGNIGIEETAGDNARRNTFVQGTLLYVPEGRSKEGRLGRIGEKAACWKGETLKNEGAQPCGTVWNVKE